MTLEVQHTLESIVDKVVEIFNMVDYGELYFKRILAACYYNQPIIIEKTHLEPIQGLIKDITPEQLKYIIDRAAYNFLNDNTAYGFADWARKTEKLRWRLG